MIKSLIIGIFIGSEHLSESSGILIYGLLLKYRAFALLWRNREGNFRTIAICFKQGQIL